MIEANEIRKGVHVQSVISNFKIVVTGFVGDRVFYDGEPVSGVRPIDEIEGIPLTEEWLLRAGFSQSGLYWVKDQVYIHDTYSLCTKYNEYALFCYKYNYAERLIVYVHQLQNLYHALTGQELEFKD
jgi:hypothetical protein